MYCTAVLSILMCIMYISIDIMYYMIVSLILLSVTPSLYYRRSLTIKETCLSVIGLVSLQCLSE